MNQFSPCPKCGSLAAQQMKFTWWGGVLGPKLLTHVKCPDCKTTFNGKSGKDNTKNIVLYSVVILVGVFALFFIAFFIFAFLTYSSNAR